MYRPTCEKVDKEHTLLDIYRQVQTTPRMIAKRKDVILIEHNMHLL